MRGNANRVAGSIGGMVEFLEKMNKTLGTKDAKNCYALQEKKHSNTPVLRAFLTQPGCKNIP